MSPPGCQARWIALVGMMGAGKSTVGKCLAQRLQKPFVDLDLRIEAAAGRSIPAIFAEEGESGFRAREHEQLAQTLQERPAGVLATGGGVVVQAANRELLKSACISVYLEVPLPLLIQRLSSARARAARPLLSPSQDALRERLQGLLNARESSYQDVQLRVDGQGSPQEVTASILLGLGAA